MSKDKKMAAYIEHTVDKDGSALGVVVTRDSMFMHTVALTQACGYTEGIVYFAFICLCSLILLCVIYLLH